LGLRFRITQRGEAADSARLTLQVVLKAGEALETGAGKKMTLDADRIELGPARSRPFLAQSRPMHRQLAVAEHHRPGLLAIPDHLPSSLLALLAWPGHLLRRQPQHRLDRGASRNIDQFVAGHLALLDQIHHGQQQLPALGEKLGQLVFVGLSLFVNRVIASFHGGSSFQRFGNPILY